MFQLWDNLGMTWDPENYGGIKTIKVHSDKLWIPDIVLYNRQVCCCIGHIWSCSKYYKTTLTWKVEALKLGHIKNFLFAVPAHITFGERIKENFIFHFIEFNVFGTRINYFSVKAEPFCPLFQSKYVSIRFYDLIS